MPTPMTRTSHSKCEQFFECPLKGYFSSIVFAEPDVIRMKNYAFTGSYVHDSIEKWFAWYKQEDVDFERLVNPVDEFTYSMNEIYNANQHTIPGEDDDEAIVLCLNNFVDFMTRRLTYLKNIKMVNCFLPLYVEKEYEMVINGVPFHGFVDAIFKDKKIYAVDWKTNKDGHISDGYIRQGTRYAIMMDQEFTNLDEFYFINLRKQVNLDHARVPISSDMKQAQKIEVRKLWDLMTGTSFPKADNTKGCFFCDHKIKCKRYGKGGITIEIPTVETTEENDPLAEWW